MGELGRHFAKWNESTYVDYKRKVKCIETERKVDNLFPGAGERETRPLTKSRVQLQLCRMNNFCRSSVQKSHSIVYLKFAKGGLEVFSAQKREENANSVVRVLISLIVVITSKCVNISRCHIAHLQLHFCQVHLNKAGWRGDWVLCLRWLSSFHTKPTHLSLTVPTHKNLSRILPAPLMLKNRTMV
jgi:hypothetical protein